MTNEMSDFEAYRILTREWTNMHHSERTALDHAGWIYTSAMELTRQGRKDEATSLVFGLITVAGCAWRQKQDKRFLN
jgi:hypothetical protein